MTDGKATILSIFSLCLAAATFACILNTGMERTAFFDGRLSAPAAQWAEPSKECGMAGYEPILIFHHNHVAFLSKVKWCKGDSMLAAEIISPLNPLPGDPIQCAFDLQPVLPTDLSYTRSK